MASPRKTRRINFQYMGSFSIIAFIIFYGLKGDWMLQDVVDKTKLSKELEEINRVENDGSDQSCNLFMGRWVYDDSYSPPYNGTQCSFMLGEYACQDFGRKDLNYQKWRWQPHDCDLPRFNGTEFLEKIRGKKLIFVGDSLNRNVWISMLCLVESSIPSSLSSPKSFTRDGNFFFFQAIEYNATIGFYWSPFLVESNNDHPYNREPECVVRLGAIERHGIQWTDADILIFDSFAWWTQPEITLAWGSFGSSDAINKTVEMKLRYFEMALNTWSDWLEIHINRTKTQLFFMSVSPTHFQWGEDMSTDLNCYNETEPILNKSYRGGYRDREMMGVVESAIDKLETRGLKVQYLNITYLSDYRKDAHPSIHKQFYHPLTEDQLKDPKNYSDCMHWCLPGVPDTWNDILYFYLMNS